MNTKHAPGPWHVAEWEARDTDGVVDMGGWQVVGADGYAISTCIGEGGGEQEETNLHFIVRACNAHYEMRNLLEEAARYLRHDPQTDLELVARIEAKLVDLAAGSVA